MYFWQQISETSNSYLGWFAYLLGSYWCILWFLMILTNCSVYGTRIVRVNYWAIQNFVLHSVWTISTHFMMEKNSCHLSWRPILVKPVFCQFRSIDQRCQAGLCFAHRAAADLSPYVCTTNWQNAVRDLRRPAWPACRGWAYVHDICENCWPGAREPHFLAFAFKKATKTLLINISKANLCNYCAQKHYTYEGFWHCPSWWAMVAIKGVYVLQLSVWKCERQCNEHKT